MSQTPEEMNSFEAVTRAMLPKPYRWDRPLPEVGAQVIVERPGGGEEVAVVTGHQPRQAADAPQAWPSDTRSARAARAATAV